MDKQSVVTDPLEQYPGYLLRRISTELMADLAAALGDVGLRPVEASVLIVIDAIPGATQSDIGRLLNIRRANMTPLATRLESRGLIRRERVDGRSNGLVLTPRADRLVASARAAMDEHERRLMERIPDQHRDGFVAALRALWATANTDMQS